MSEVEHLVVVEDLRVEPVEVVARGLDLPAGQRPIYQAHVHSRGAQHDRELRPYSVLAEVRVVAANACDQRRSDVDISHTRDDTGGRQTEKAC